MKPMLRVCLTGLFMLIAACIPTWAGDSQVAGVWTATMHNQPCIKLTVHDSGGQLSGKIIFYLLVLEDGTWRVKGNDEVALIHPRLENNAFVFEVVHAKKHGSTDPANQELKTFRMELTGRNEGVFKNAIEGQDLILTRLAE
jgi:hypothetical protein